MEVARGERGRGCRFFIGFVALLVVSSLSLTTTSAKTVTIFSDELQLATPAAAGWDIEVRTYGRGLLQTPSVNNSLILAAERTRRRDPSHNLKYYTGGWDIEKGSYWASVAYTGLPGFILALIWLGLGLLLLIVFCGCLCCCRHHMKREHDHGAAGYYIPLVLLLLFSAAAIGGCYALFWGQQKFHNELQSTLDSVVDQSYSTEQGLRNVSSYFSQASTINITNNGLPTSEIQQIRDLNVKIDQAASDLRNKTDSNADDIQNSINIVRLILIIVSGVMLLLVLLGLAFSACGIRSVVYFLVVVGWLLVVGTWILCGVFITLQNVMGDTCVAMEQWVANPSAQSTMDAILPCVDPQTSATTLATSKETVSTLADNTNLVISSYVNSNVRAPPLFYNQSGPAVPLLCNPYGPAPNYADQACSNGTVIFENAPGEWAKYICPSNNGACTGPGRLTQDTYNQLVASANVCYGLEKYTPFLVDLQNCQIARNVFTDIVDNHCHGLRKSTKWVWIGLAIVSAGSMLSVLLWMVYIRRRNMRYRKKNRNGKAETSVV